MKNCILFLTHNFDDFAKDLFIRLKNDLETSYDVWVLYNSNVNDIDPNITDKVFLFNEESVLRHGFKIEKYYVVGNKTFYGNNIEYSYLTFYLEHPEYSFYWLIEHDVYCNGNWLTPISYYDEIESETDFLTTHFGQYDGGGWWEYFKNCIFLKSVTDKSKYYSCFNPVDRFSNKALKTISDSYLIKGDICFYEIGNATILMNNNCTVKEFTKYLNNDTIVASPAFTDKTKMLKDTIYHPVKYLLPLKRWVYY